MGIRDQNRSRKTYSFYRAPPIPVDFTINLFTGSIGDITGTWRDSGHTFITTGSVSIDRDNKSANSPTDPYGFRGGDIFFYVSGSIGLQVGNPARNVSVLAEM